MKVLYIGGTGEISHACVHRSVAMGHDVTVFNRGRRTHDDPLPEAVTQVQGDLKNEADYRPLGEGGFDVVCQFLAYDQEAVARDVEVFGGRCTQYVFISTTSAYQKPPTRIVMTEDVPLANPYWPYSQAKADMEQYLFAQHAAGRIPVTVVRPSHTHRTKFPGGMTTGDEWAWRILQGKEIIATGDGTSLWTLTYSTDFAKGFCGLLGKEAALGEAFHITRPMESFTWNDIYREVGRALGTETKIVHVPTETLVRYRPAWAGPLLGDKTWSVLFDNTKVLSVAGEFTCEVGLAEGLARAAEFYRRRQPDHKPDLEVHALLDRIIADQKRLGDEN